MKRKPCLKIRLVEHIAIVLNGAGEFFQKFGKNLQKLLFFPKIRCQPLIQLPALISFIAHSSDHV